MVACVFLTLMLFSLRPGRYLAISAHWFPTSQCARARMYSSRLTHGSLLMSGLRSFCTRLEQVDECCRSGVLVMVKAITWTRSKPTVQNQKHDRQLSRQASTARDTKCNPNKLTPVLYAWTIHLVLLSALFARAAWD